MHIKEILDNRIMVLDGAMGTMIQQYGLTEKDFRGERFSDTGILQKGTTTCFALPNRKLSLRYTKHISMPSGHHRNKLFQLHTHIDGRLRNARTHYGNKFRSGSTCAKYCRRLYEKNSRQTPICSRLGRSYQQDLLHVSRGQQSGFPCIDIR